MQFIQLRTEPEKKKIKALPGEYNEADRLEAGQL